MDVHRIVRRVFRPPRDRTYELDKARALERLQARLSRSGLDAAEQAVIMAFHRRDGLPARQLGIAVIVARTERSDRDDVTAACDALCDRRILWKCRGTFGDASYLLDRPLLESFLGDAPRKD